AAPGVVDQRISRDLAAAVQVVPDRFGAAERADITHLENRQLRRRGREPCGRRDDQAHRRPADSPSCLHPASLRTSSNAPSVESIYLRRAVSTDIDDPMLGIADERLQVVRYRASRAE